MTRYHACADAAFLATVEGFELIPDIVRRLAEGKPVEIGEIAMSAKRPGADVERFLWSQPGTEWDDDGRLVGFGLTTRPTDHRFVVRGRSLYTWCATDTLLFTAILRQPTSVESTCPATGDRVTIELSPEAVVSVEPADAVVSQRHHGGRLADIRAEICAHGRFFASPAAAGTWGSYPEDHVVTVAEAFASAQEACRELGWL